MSELYEDTGAGGESGIESWYVWYWVGLKLLVGMEQLAELGLLFLNS
jgi:hypothetical protein